MQKTDKKIVRVQTRMGAFECLFIPNTPEKGYTVTVPKLKGVVTFGDDEREGTAMVKEAIELHCACLLEKGLAEVRQKKEVKARVSMRSR